MRQASNSISHHTAEDTLTISSRYTLHYKRVIGAIKKGIKGAYKKGEHPKTMVSLYGDGENANKSRAFHIVFHRKLDDGERSSITKFVVDIGRENKWVADNKADEVLCRWIVHNTNKYLQKHTGQKLWVRVC